MCGIAGVYSFDGTSRIEVVKAMTDILAHRGPDGDGFYIDGGMVLGHRRLKIIDLSERAKQPIADAARRAIVTFNGEIYNFKELRRDLAARGHVFASSGDAETIPLAYLEWGRAFLERLHGMFAFALYDSSRRLLILARDRIGIKPLYIAKTPQFVAFASEIKALVGSGLIEPCINRRAIAEYVELGYHFGGKSWFDGIYELPPAHVATIDPSGNLSTSRYWHIPDPPPKPGSDPAPRLRAALDAAATTHLQSDVPVGAHLSGGIDSSSVVALMATRLREQLHTFSVYFAEGGRYDEREYVEPVSTRYNTIHHYTVPTWRDAQDLLESIVWTLDEPTAGPGVIAQYLLNRDIRARRIVVANGGQGGDELFGGYTRHLLPYALAAAAGGGLRETVATLRSLGWPALLSSLAHLPLNPGRLVLHRDLRKSVAGAQRSMRFDDTLRAELDRYLPALLHIEDRTSMAFSVESRVPLLDDAVISLAASTHRSWKVRNGVTKCVLRDAMRDLLPEKVFARRDKRGLETPFGQWLRGPLRSYTQTILTDPALRRASIFDIPRLQRIFKLHCAGYADMGFFLWRPITTAIWLDLVQRSRRTTREAVASR